MARGRKAEPAELKAAKGNPGRRRISKAQDDVLADLGGAPSWLDVSKRSRADGKAIARLAIETWQKLQPLAVSMKLLKATDEWALGRFCQYMAEWTHFKNVLAEKGYWYEKEQGNGATAMLPHPAARARLEAERALKDLGDAMGLTPSARMRITQQLAQSLPPQPGLPGMEGAVARDQPAPRGSEAGGMPEFGGAGLKPGFLN